MNHDLSPSTFLQLALAANYSTNGFPALISTLTEPSGAGVFAAGLGGAEAENGVYVLPFGTGSDGNTFSMRVYCWNLFPGPHDGVSKSLWVPGLLCEVACTISSTNVGADGSLVSASNYFAKTMTITTGPTTAGTSVEVVSPAAGGLYATLMCDIKGAKKIQFTFSTGGVATDCNALWRFSNTVMR